MKTINAFAAVLLSVGISGTSALADETSSRENAEQFAIVNMQHATFLSDDELDLVTGAHTRIKIAENISPFPQDILVPADIVPRLDFALKAGCTSPERCVLPTDAVDAGLATGHLEISAQDF